MIDVLAPALVVLPLLLAAAALVLAALNRSPSGALLLAVVAVEALLVVQALVALGFVLAGQRPGSVATFLGYALVSTLVLPLGTLWALEERTRWSTVVLAGSAATAASLVLRMLQVWEGASA